MRFFLLPLWAKVAIGGLRPPVLFGTPMLCIGYAQSAMDEGSVSAETPHQASLGEATLSHEGRG